MAVSILAETALSAAVMVSLTLSLRISGTTLSEPNRSFGSSSVTNPLAEIDGSVLKMLAACAWPLVSALTTAAPFSGRKFAGVKPYSDLSPTRPC